MLVILGVVIILMKAQRIKINVSKTRKFVINRKCFQLCSRISNQFGWMAMVNVKLSGRNMQLSTGRNFQDNTLPNLCLLNRNFLRNKANNSQRWGFQREKQKTKQIERERESGKIMHWVDWASHYRCAWCAMALEWRKVAYYVFDTCQSEIYCFHNHLSAKNNTILNINYQISNKDCSMPML